MVDDHQPITQMGSLVHVVSGEKHGNAARFQEVELVPNEQSGLWVKSGCRFIEDENARLVHECTGDEQSSPHTTRKMVRHIVRPVCELKQLESFKRPRSGDIRSQVKKSAESQQVLNYVEIGVQTVRLRHDPHDLLDVTLAFPNVHAEHGQSPGRHRRDARNHLHRGSLAGSIGSKKAETLTALNLEVDPIDRGYAAIALE